MNSTELESGVTVKPWYTSKTLVVNLLALVAAGAAATGNSFGLAEAVQVELAAAIMAIVNIVLRFATTMPIKNH